MSQDESPAPPADHTRAPMRPRNHAALQHFVVTTQLISPTAPLTYINAQRAAARFPLHVLNQLRADLLHHLDMARAKAKTLSASQTILYDSTESDALFMILNALMNQAQHALRKHVDENLSLDDSHEHEAYPAHSHPHEDFEDE